VKAVEHEGPWKWRMKSHFRKPCTVPGMVMIWGLRNSDVFTNPAGVEISCLFYT